nr:DDE-type integrase/transposase/recombinase [Clostridium gasigenes]
MIEEANNHGARLIPACDVVGISKRTFERWRLGDTINEDKRKNCIRPEPKNKLSKEERQSVLNIVSIPEYADLPPTHIADGPNQVWTWDITWLNIYTRRVYFKLYTIIDIYSRKIVGWEFWTEETGELAADLVERATLTENTKGKPLVLH